MAYIIKMLLSQIRVRNFGKIPIHTKNSSGYHYWLPFFTSKVVC